MDFMRITSAANPSIKLAKNLAQHSRAARKEGLSLAEGIHLARELLSHPELVRKVFLREGAEKNFEISEILQKYLSLKISVVQLPSQIYASISPVDTSAGIVCEIRIPEEGKIKKDEDWIYLDGVQDPGNVGTILTGFRCDEYCVVTAMCLRLVSQSASCSHGSSFLLQHYFFRRACRDQRKNRSCMFSG